MPFAVVKFEKKTPERKKQGVEFDGCYIFIDPKQQGTDSKAHPKVTGRCVFF